MICYVCRLKRPHQRADRRLQHFCWSLTETHTHTHTSTQLRSEISQIQVRRHRFFTSIVLKYNIEGSPLLTFGCGGRVPHLPLPTPMVRPLRDDITYSLSVVACRLIYNLLPSLDTHLQSQIMLLKCRTSVRQRDWDEVRCFEDRHLKIKEIRRFGRSGAVFLSLRTQVFCVRTLIWYSCLFAYANHLTYANFGILTSSVRKIGIPIFFAYAGGILGLFHVEGKINATGGMLYRYCLVLVPGTLWQMLGISLTFSSKWKKIKNYIDISITDFHQNIFLSFCSEDLWSNQGEAPSCYSLWTTCISWIFTLSVPSKINGRLTHIFFRQRALTVFRMDRLPTLAVDGAKYYIVQHMFKKAYRCLKA